MKGRHADQVPRPWQVLHIECPEGTRLVRGADRPGGDLPFLDHLVVPLNGKLIRIPADPPELLPLLAESGNFDVTLVGEPEPDVRLAGAACPGCGRRDLTWLQSGEGSETVHCDYRGARLGMERPARRVRTVSTALSPPRET
jgi:hypothetical protein